MVNRFNPHELSHMAGSLSRVSETKTTSEWLWGQASRFVSEWKSQCRVTAREIPLPLPRIKGLVPSGTYLEGVFLSFVFECGEDSHLPKQADFQVLVRGTLCGCDSSFEVEDHWRVDTHVDEDKGASQPPQEVHPRYHFQRGGHAQDSFAADETFVPGKAKGISGEWRGLFQCEWPRMPALPMDPIVGLDFCIGQANGMVWKRLRNESEYYGLVENAQKRVWLPFLHGLSEPNFRRKWLGELVM